MSVEGKITLRKEQYIKELNAVRNETNAAAKEMQQGVKQYGTEINKAGIATRFISAEAGSSIVSLGRAFQVLAAGPIAIVTAAIAGIAVVLKKVNDELTTSTEEYNLILEKKASLQKKDVDNMTKQQSEEDGLLKRLVELNEQESKTNEENDEAIRLTHILAGRYKDLGIEIDGTTGQFKDLADAMRRINEEQKKQKLDALANELATLQSKSDALAKDKFKGGKFNRALDWMNSALGGTDVGKKEGENYVKKTYEERLDYARKMMDSGLTTEEDINFWADEAERMQEIIKLEKEMLDLRRGDTDELKEKSVESRKVADAEEEAWKKRVAELDEEAKKQAEMDKKHGEELARQLEKEQQIAEAMKKGIEQRRVADLAGMAFSAIRKSGRGYEADWREAVYRESVARGEELDADSIKDIKKRVRMRRALDSLSIASPVDYAPRVNSLIARGGSAQAMQMPKVEDLQSRTLSSVAKIQQITSRILSNIDEMTTT